MMDFFTEVFSAANIAATGLMILVVLYWLLVILGVVGLDVFDIDIDVDADLGIDADFGVDVDLDGGVATAPGSQLGGGNATTANESFLSTLFDFFFLGDVPIVIIGSFLALFFWITTFLSNHYFNPEQQFVWALAWLVPNLIATIVLTRIALFPVAILFRKPPPEDTTRSDLLGLVGLVTTSEVTDQFGQIEVRLPQGTEILLNVRAAPGDRLAKGDAARIKQYNNDNGTFLVELTKWETPADE